MDSGITFGNEEHIRRLFYVRNVSGVLGIVFLSCSATNISYKPSYVGTNSQFIPNSADIIADELRIECSFPLRLSGCSEFGTVGRCGKFELFKENEFQAVKIVFMANRRSLVNR